MKWARWVCGLLCVAWAGSAAAEVTVTERTRPDGQRVVVMENPALRLTVDPARGGRVSSFIWKATGKDWVMPGNAGFFMDHVWQQTWPGELLDRQYDVRIVASGPDQGTVQASVTIEGKGDKAIEGVRLTRTMTLAGDSPRVDVTIRLDNATAEPRSPGLWVQNVINVGHSRDGVWTWRPTARGTIRASFNTKLGKAAPEGYKDDFCFDPIAGWSAETYPPSDEGVLFFVDYNYLRTLYNSAGSQSVEWWYEQVRLAPGKSFETKVTVWPVSDMAAVTYACPTFVADLQMPVEGKSMTLVNRLVAGPEAAAGTAKVKLQLIDYDTGQELHGKRFDDVSVTATPSEQKLAIPNAPLAKNLLARATVTIHDGKSRVYENYRHAPAVMGTERLYKTARPPRVRPIDRPAVIAKTPHKGFRILHLRGLFQRYYRLPEAAKAMGAELKHGSYRTFVYGPSLSYFPSSYPELMAFDAIVLNNVPIEAVDDQTQQYLIDYVEHGGVLLVIGGHWSFGGGQYQGSKLGELLPATTKGRFDVRPVTDGLLLPQPEGGQGIATAWMQDVTPRPETQVTIRAGGKPFWVECKRGRGVVAVMAGLCYGEAPRGTTLFTEWSGWPGWLAGRLQAMAAQTGK